jgi:PAS domain S-box-containing protein
MRSQERPDSAVPFRSAAIGYLLAILGTAAATLLRWALDPVLGTSSQYLFHYVAVIVAALVGGTRPGVLAVGLGALSGTGLFIYLQRIEESWVDDVIRLAFFLAFGAIATGLTHRLFATRDALAVLAGQLREAAEASRRAEEQARRVAELPEQNPSPVLRIDEDAGVVYANPAAERLLAGQEWLTGNAPAALAALASSVFRTGQAATADVACGTAIFSFTCVPVHSTRCVNLYGHEVTEARRAETLVRDSEARFRGLYEHAPVGIGQVSLDGRFQMANPALCHILGYAVDELLQRTVIEITHPDDRGREAALVETMLRRERDFYLIEKRYLRRDASPIWVSITSSLVTDPGGQPLCRISIVQDITERRNAEAALARSERRFRELADAMPQIVWTSRPDGHLDYYNRRWYELTGASEHEGGDQSWLPVMHPDDRQRCLDLWYEAVRSGTPYEIEYRFKFPSTGEYRWHLGRALPARDDSGAIVRWYGTCTDVHDLRAAQEELIAARRSAEQANSAKDQFLAVLSHELRTPLTPVLNGIALLEKDRTLPERARDYLEMFRRNIELESRLIDDLLDVTRIAQGKVELDRRHVPLCTIIERAVEVCRPDIDARRLHLGVDLGPRPYLVDADAARLQQVFWNLLKNAVKFTPHGGCVGLRCWPDDGQVVVQVQDSGIGIDPSAIARIFHAFSQAERSITRRFGGLGLGLAITRTLVELHGGSITAQSDGKDRGATFTVRLPLVAAGPGSATAGAPAASAEGRERGRRHLRILLVEDHGDAVTTLVDIFELLGHAVDTAGDVATALAMAADREFDILVSDLGLPDGSGFDLLAELRSRGRQVPAIALSGYGQEGDRQRSAAAGFRAHLVKPVDPDRLLDAMESALDATAS